MNLSVLLFLEENEEGTNFEDGFAPTVEDSEESANKFCLIGKSNGKVLEYWDDKPSESAVAKRVKEIKTFD